MSTFLIGGDDTIHVLEELGLAYPCEMDEHLIVPYVHLFPLEVDVLQPSSSCMQQRDEDDDDESTTSSSSSSSSSSSNESKTLILVTDCHPKVLSRTTVGASEDGAVMYIGPDSLALVQHLPLQDHLRRKFQDQERRQEIQGTNNANKNSPTRTSSSSSSSRILDFCTGSGIQALSTLMSLERLDPNATAVCVDYNERALRFTKFNALLNGIDAGRIHLIRADLISGDLLPLKQKEEIPLLEDGDILDGLDYENNIMGMLIGTRSGEVDEQLNMSNLFDVILANPPFIPVPGRCTIKGNKDSSNDTNIRDSISRRYGLFSSGGSSGEEVLQSIISMSSRLLRPNDGILAIVSEFMNPPLSPQTIKGGDEGRDERQGNVMTDKDIHVNDTILHKLHKWWYDSPHDDDDDDESTCTGPSRSRIAGGNGILFTNEFPVSAETYSSRRADDENEYVIWMKHLKDFNIHHISPGMLYIRSTTGTCKIHDEEKGIKKYNDDVSLLLPSLKVSSGLVPKHNTLGSIWTPYNHAAVSFTRFEWRK